MPKGIVELGLARAVGLVSGAGDASTCTEPRGRCVRCDGSHDQRKCASRIRPPRSQLQGRGTMDPTRTGPPPSLGAVIACCGYHAAQPRPPARARRSRRPPSHHPQGQGRSPERSNWHGQLSSYLIDSQTQSATTPCSTSCARRSPRCACGSRTSTPTRNRDPASGPGGGRGHAYEPAHRRLAAPGPRRCPARRTPARRRRGRRDGPTTRPMLSHRAGTPSASRDTQHARPDRQREPPGTGCGGRRGRAQVSGLDDDSCATESAAGTGLHGGIRRVGTVAESSQMPSHRPLLGLVASFPTCF